MPQAERKERIVSLKVNGLFGRFDHDIVFPEGQDITIITAPNGFGKTILLKTLDSIFNRKFHYFWKIPFDEIELAFTSGKKITVLRDQGNLLEEEDLIPRRTLSLKASGFGDSDAVYKLSPSMPEADEAFLDRHLPVDRLAPDRWVDMQTDDIVPLEVILDRYSERLPKRILNSLRMPEWIQELAGILDVYLVETQRLLYLDQEPEHRRPYGRRGKNPPPVVERDARALSKIIGDLLQRYANESQKLDQTFPKRIIAFRDGNVGSEEEIRSSLLALSDRREELVSAGLLSSSISDPIRPDDEFEDEGIRRMLAIYIEDTTKKLSIFDDAYAKINLFKEIINEHFSFKHIEINSKSGIEAIDELDGERVPLSELSSGEQHELVLIYDLLFRVEDDSVILIDEPELSLHVAWQKRFISDLQKILEIRRLQVIIATHSPQVINDKWNLVQELAK